MNIQTFSNATNLGSKVHDVAQKIVLGEAYEVEDEIKPYVDNVKKIVSEIKEDYPEVVEAENKFKISLSELDFDSDLTFLGYIDCVFKDSDGNYLIVDWKTSKRTNYASSHRRQLLAYKKAYCKLNDIDESSVNVAIGYVGLRKRVNTGEIGYKLEDKQPTKRSYNTFRKYVNRLLNWIDNPDKFCKEIIEANKNTHLWKITTDELRKYNLE